MRVTFSVDASSESGADFLYDIISAPTQKCAIIVIKAYLRDGLCIRSAEVCHIHYHSQFDCVNYHFSIP